MSTFRILDTKCPSCGHPMSVEIARGLHITRLPRIREKLISGTHQLYTCERCKQATQFESTTVYTDFERHEYVAVETPHGASWQAAVARHKTVFRDCFEHGPPVAQEMGQQFKRRIVFGFAALREKLVLWDAGLDDRVVEACKGDLLREEEVAPKELVLRISTVLDGGHLLFGVFEPVVPDEGLRPDTPRVLPRPTPVDFMTAPAASYAARLADPGSIARDYPWLDDEWFVDVHDGPSYLYA